MSKIVKADGSPYLKLVTEDGRIEYVGWLDLFNNVWDDYVHGMLPNSYTRGVLFDLGLTSHQVWQMMEKLQMGKSEYETGDYLEVSYI